MSTVEKGRVGENLADVYFSGLGYDVIARNYRRGRGEIDLVLRKNDEIVFVEVKYWSAYSEDAIEYGINPGKRARILRSSRHFLMENPQYDEFHIRYDVLFLPGTGKTARHIRDAFGEDK